MPTKCSSAKREGILACFGTIAPFHHLSDMVGNVQDINSNPQPFKRKKQNYLRDL